MKKIATFISALLAYCSVSYAKDIYSVLSFTNKSALSFDFSLFVKASPSGSSTKPGYSNPAWLGKFSPDGLSNNPVIPIAFEHAAFPVSTYYWTDQSFFNSQDSIGFDLITAGGKKMGLTGKGFGAHYCNFQSDDDGKIIVYDFEENGGEYVLYAIMPSGGCSFKVTDGFGPWPALTSVATDINVDNTSVDIDDGRQNLEIQMQKNPSLLKHLDDIYFEATGVNRAGLRAKKNKQISIQVKPFF